MGRPRCVYTVAGIPHFDRLRTARASAGPTVSKEPDKPHCLLKEFARMKRTVSEKALHGFTLIELLIVVAIIAILAAIAVPNFLEAQIRSKVSRAQADMRSIATALEAYAVDYNRYPPDEVWINSAANPLPPPIQEERALAALSRLTTPVAFMTSILRNPFPNETDEQPVQSYFRYFGREWKAEPGVVGALPAGAATSKEWSLGSAGPDGISNLGEWLMWGEDILNQQNGFLPFWGPGGLYDPTNGTISDGDIVRVGP